MRPSRREREIAAGQMEAFAGSNLQAISRCWRCSDTADAGKIICLRCQIDLGALASDWMAKETARRAAVAKRRKTLGW